MRKRRLIKIGAAVLLIVIALSGGGYYLTHNYDPVRVVYKRYKAPSKYIFEEIAPRFRRTDPARLIRVRTRAEAQRAREDLTKAIWGGNLPTGVQPAKIERDYRLPRLEGTPGLKSVDRLTIPVGRTYTAYGYHLKPVGPTGRAVLYQHGYAGTIEDVRALLERLLSDGYHVIALNNYNYGQNRTRETEFPRFGHYYMRLWDFLNLIEHPLRVYFHPIAVATNHAIATLDVRNVGMIGFSNGGWMTMVAAAMDPRISKSYPISGAYPIYLRSGETKVNQPEHYYRPMLQAATYLDMFVLGALEPKRRQIQVFSRFDRCCWRNLKARLYEPVVQKSLKGLNGGRFGVVIDETHADHKISSFAMDQVLKDLRRP